MPPGYPLTILFCMRTSVTNTMVTNTMVTAAIFILGKQIITICFVSWHTIAKNKACCEQLEHSCVEESFKYILIELYQDLSKFVNVITYSQTKKKGCGIYWAIVYFSLFFLFYCRSGQLTEHVILLRTALLVAFCSQQYSVCYAGWQRHILCSIQRIS